MTFEEEKMAQALSALKAMEKRCSAPPGTGGGFSANGGGGGTGGMSFSPSFSSLQSMKSRVQGLLGASQSGGQDKATTVRKQEEITKITKPEHRLSNIMSNFKQIPYVCQ